MKEPTLFVPSRKEIEEIHEGGFALDCWGRMSKVVSVTAKREDIEGKLFCCYNTHSGPGSSISMSQKENQLTRHVGTSTKYKSAELDEIEKTMRAERG